MAKAYWVATYRSISNPDALAAYAKIAGPAIAAAGGRFLARGNAAKAYEKGVPQRVVLIEFDSIDKAVAAHDSPAYQEALKALGNGAERDETEEGDRGHQQDAGTSHEDGQNRHGRPGGERRR